MQVTKPIISVAITAFKRPVYIELAIKSFLYQSCSASELLIIDDCVEDTSVRSLVHYYMRLDKRIRFIKNRENLGYCKNFLKSLNESKGKYIITLGDDDILIDKNALTRYISVFEKYPDVSYVYSNMVQINPNSKVDYVFDLFDVDLYCSGLDISLRKVWLRSCFIAGIGLRNNIDFNKLYPDDNILFPQVELIGKILGSSSAYAISDRLIGARSHIQQLGNVALSKKNIIGSERHSVYELNLIYSRVLAYYREKLNKNFVADSDFINTFFQTNHKAIFANEKISNGNFSIIKTFVQAVKNNVTALLDLPFVFYFLICLFLPRIALLEIKEYYKKLCLRPYTGLLQKLESVIFEIKNV